MLIQAKGLSKIYGSGENQVVALDKANLTIAPGDFEEALPSLNDIFLLYTTTTDPAVPTTVNENPAPESAETADKSLTREETGVQTTTNNNLQ